MRLISLTLLSAPSLWLIAHSFGCQVNPGVSINKYLDPVSNTLTENSHGSLDFAFLVGHKIEVKS
ncbi:MAG: hypothetical protein PVG03_07305, partial [Desulfarculaceae bacterium]